MTDVSVTEVYSAGAVPVDIAVGDHHGIEVLVVDALQGEVDVAGQLGIKGERSLPCLRHAQVLAQDGGTAGDGSRAGGPYLLQHIFLRSGKGRDGALGLRGDVRRLSHAGVTHGGDEPHERHAAHEQARTTTEYQVTVARDVPVEAYTR